MEHIILKKEAFDSLNKSFEEKREDFSKRTKRNLLWMDCFSKDMGDISTIIHLFLNFAFFSVCLITTLATLSYFDIEIQEKGLLLMSLAIFSVCCVSGRMLYLTNKEKKEIDLIYENEFDQLKEMKQKTNKLQEDYFEVLKSLNINRYLNMSLEDIGDLSVVEQNILTDFKQRLESTSEGNLYKFLNENKIKNTVLETL